MENIYKCPKCGDLFEGDIPVKENIIYVPLLDIPENEIERAAADAFDTATARLGFTYGVEWYKQQLKNKQI
jgi:hypothetical protein